MDRSEAHQHLELVGEILSRAESRINCIPSLFIVWGVASALSTVVLQLILGGTSINLMWIAGTGFIVAIINQIVLMIRLNRSRESRTWLGKQIGRMFGASFGTAGLVAYGAPQIFHGWAMSVLFSAAAIIALLFIAQQGDRKAGVAALVMLASVIAGSWIEPLRGYILAAGWILGYSGLGIAYALQRRDG